MSKLKKILCLVIAVAILSSNFVLFAYADDVTLISSSSNLNMKVKDTLINNSIEISDVKTVNIVSSAKPETTLCVFDPYPSEGDPLATSVDFVSSGQVWVTYNSGTLTIGGANLKLSSTDALFYGFFGATTLSISSSVDVSEVTNMSSMFYGCSSVTSVDLSNFTFTDSTIVSDMLNFEEISNPNDSSGSFACKEIKFKTTTSATNIDLLTDARLSFPTEDTSYTGKWVDNSDNSYTSTPTQGVKMLPKGTYKWEEKSPYGIYVGGKAVTEVNKDNVLGDGKVSYDKDAKTLTLNGATIDFAISKTAVGPTKDYVTTQLYTAIEYSGSGTLNIELSGDNKINTIPLEEGTPVTQYYAIISGNSFGKCIDGDFTFKNLSISGDGSLKLCNHFDENVASIDDSVSYKTVFAKAKDITISGATVEFGGYFTEGIVATGDGTDNKGTISIDDATIKGNTYGANYIKWFGLSNPIETESIIKADGDISITGESKISTFLSTDTWLGSVVYSLGKVTIDLEGEGLITAYAGSPIKGNSIVFGEETFIKTPEGAEISNTTTETPSQQDTTITRLKLTEIDVKVVQKYTVAFDGNGSTSGSMSSESFVIGKEKALTKNTFEKTGYNFIGWNTDKTATTALYTDEQSVKDLSTTNGATVTLYAIWTPKSYTITYNLDNGTNDSGNPSSYTIESNAITLANPTRTGYTFGGWYDNKDFTGSAVTTIAAGSTADKEYWAKWTVINYNITFNKNDGAFAQGYTQPSTYTVEDKTTLPTKDNITKNGYTFDGWFDNAQLTGSAVTEIAKGTTGDKAYYAKWTPTSYTITYNLDNGTNDSGNPSSYTIESSAITLKDPTKTGYTFGGWYDNSSFTGSAVTTIAAGSTADKEYWAKWTVINYNITFNKNDGAFAQGYTQPSTYTVEDKTTLPTKDNITKNGCTFGGWYDNAQLTGSAVTEIAKGTTGDKSYFAKWTLNTYDVTFNTDGKATVETQKVKHGELVTQPSDPTADGYVFKGWYKDDLSTPWDFEAFSITVDTVIYAKWVKVDTDTPKSGDAIVDNTALEKVAKQFAKESHDVNSSVIVKATVDENVPQSDKDLLKSKGTKDLTLFNTSLLLVVDGGTPVDIGNSNDVLVSITYKFDFTKKTNLQTFRVHAGTLDELKETPNEDGEFVKYDKDAGTITVTAKKYSTYAFAYDVVTDPVDDSSSKSSTSESSSISTTDTNTNNEVLANTADTNAIGAFVALSAFAAAGFVTVKKKEN